MGVEEEETERDVGVRRLGSLARWGRCNVTVPSLRPPVVGERRGQRPRDPRSRRGPSRVPQSLRHLSVLDDVASRSQSSKVSGPTVTPCRLDGRGRKSVLGSVFVGRGPGRGGTCLDPLRCVRADGRTRQGPFRRGSEERSRRRWWYVGRSDGGDPTSGCRGAGGG